MPAEYKWLEFKNKRIFLIAAGLLSFGVIIIVTFVLVFGSISNSVGDSIHTISTADINSVSGGEGSDKNSTTDSIVIAEEDSETISSGSCEVLSTNQNSPLLIYTGTTTLIYPESASNKTTIAYNQTIDVSCPGNRVIIGQKQYGPLVKATCKNNELFFVNGAVVQWKNVSCSSAVNPTVKQLPIQDIQENDVIKDCYNVNSNINVTVGSIGFTIDEDRYLSFIKICFNINSRIALYSYYELTAAINYRARSVSNARFRQDDIFYRMAISNQQLYINNQTTINGILGVDATSDMYINSKTFIEMGHLAAKSDFYYAILQIASYRFINVAPQWNTFNGGNWNQIEIDVRDYAINNKINLQIWTGTHGIATLPNVVNSNTENLYLYVNKNDNRNSPCFPVPAIFWKLVYEPLSQKGIVLVGHNNPHINVTFYFNQKVCDIDVSEQVNWLNWDKNDPVKGYSYACSYSDNKFQTTVSFVPQIIVKGLLI